MNCFECGGERFGLDQGYRYCRHCGTVMETMSVW